MLKGFKPAVGAWVIAVAAGCGGMEVEAPIEEVMVQGSTGLTIDGCRVTPDVPLLLGPDADGKYEVLSRGAVDTTRAAENCLVTLRLFRGEDELDQIVARSYPP